MRCLIRRQRIRRDDEFKNKKYFDRIGFDLDCSHYLCVSGN